MKSKLLEFIWQSLSDKPIHLKIIIAGFVVALSSKICYQKWISTRPKLPASSQECTDCSCKSPKKKKLRILCGSSRGRSEKLSRKCFDLLNNDSQIASLFDVEWRS